MASANSSIALAKYLGKKSSGCGNLKSNPNTRSKMSSAWTRVARRESYVGEGIVSGGVVFVGEEDDDDDDDDEMG